MALFGCRYESKTHELPSASSLRLADVWDDTGVDITCDVASNQMIILRLGDAWTCTVDIVGVGIVAAATVRLVSRPLAPIRLASIAALLYIGKVYAVLTQIGEDGERVLLVLLLARRQPVPPPLPRLPTADVPAAPSATPETSIPCQQCASPLNVEWCTRCRIYQCGECTERCRAASRLRCATLSDLSDCATCHEGIGNSKLCLRCACYECDTCKFKCEET